MSFSRGERGRERKRKGSSWHETQNQAPLIGAYAHCGENGLAQGAYGQIYCLQLQCVQRHEEKTPASIL